MPHGHWQISTLFTIPTHKPFAVLFPPASRHLPVGYPVHKYEVASSFSITPCHDWVPTHLRQNPSGLSRAIHQTVCLWYSTWKLCFHAPGHGTDSTLLHCPPPVRGRDMGIILVPPPLSEKGVLRSETCRLCQFTPSCQTMRYWGTSLSGLRQ